MNLSGEFVPTGSFNTFSSSILTYTGSVDSRLGSLEITSGSNITRLSSIESTTGSLNTASGSAITRLNALEVTSGSNITRISALETASGSAITRLNSIESKTGSYATTGSNTFDGGQYLSSSFNPTGFSTTASLYTDGGLRVTKDAYISGTLYLNNVTVFGTQSVAYISSSQLNIGTNLITVNTDTPSIRFGGLAVYDSGSTGLTGSILWDSETNHWVYSNPSGSTYSGGMFISGPRTSTLGSETGTTSCMLMAGQGGDHITSSMIYHSSTVTCIPNTLINTGQICAPTVVASTCLAVKAGAATSVVNNIAGAASNNHFAIQRNDTQYASIGLNGSDNFTVFGTSTSCPRLTIDSNGISCFGGNVCAAGNLLLGGAGTANTIPQYTAAGVLGNSRMTTYGNGCFSVNFGWSNCGRIGFDNDNTGTYFYGLELDQGTRRLNIIGKAPDGNAGVSIWTGTTSYCQRFNINADGVACFSCQVCTAFISANAIDVSNGGASTPTNACVGYGMFGYSGVGLGITSGASGGNQGIGFFVCGVERGRWITSGNLGIGTVCPSFPLDVNGIIRSTSTLIGNQANISTSTICTIASTTLSSSRGIVVDANTTTNNAFVPIGFSWASSISSYDPTWGMAFKAINYNAGTADLAFYTAGNVRMTITNGGSVGIATASPAARLDVSGTVKISDGGRLYINQFLPLGIVFRNDEFPDGDGNNTKVSDAQATNGDAKRRLSSAPSTTFFYGPYTTIPAGTYIAYFRLKVTSNASASNILYMDITNVIIPGGGITINPNSFTTSNRYQYFKIPFIVTDPTNVIEFRGLSFVGGITDIFLDHIMILPGS